MWLSQDVLGTREIIITCQAPWRGVETSPAQPLLRPTPALFLAPLLLMPVLPPAVHAGGAPAVDTAPAVEASTQNMSTKLAWWAPVDETFAMSSCIQPAYPDPILLLLLPSIRLPWPEVRSTAADAGLTVQQCMLCCCVDVGACHALDGRLRSSCCWIAWFQDQDNLQGNTNPGPT